MPHAGFSWVYQTIPAYAKMLVGEHALKNGVSYTRARENEIEDLVFDLLPQFKPFYDGNGDHVKSLGYTLTHRASVYVEPNKGGAGPEYRRFRQDQWTHHFMNVQRAMEKGTAIHDDDIAGATEKILITEYSGKAGVYFRQDPHRPEVLYIGMGSDVARRSRGHFNSTTFLVQVIATGDTRGARLLESYLHQCAILMGAESIRDKGRGLFRFQAGVNGVQEMNTLMRTDIRCRSILRSITRPKKKEPT